MSGGQGEEEDTVLRGMHNSGGGLCHLDLTFPLFSKFFSF